MATALDLITSALRLTNVLASGEVCPADMASDGLNVLNDMIDSWNTMRLAIYTTRSDDFPLVLNKQSYTLGPNGDFNMARPPEITGMSSILLYNPQNPVEVPITMYSVEDWQNQVPVKAVAGSFPLICYDTGDFPLRTLNMWPIPTGQPVSVRIYSWQALTEPPTLATVLGVPPGYRKAFRFNLAVDLAAEFSQPVPIAVADGAVKSLAAVKSANMPQLGLKSDLVPDPSGWDYKADLFGIGL